MSKTPTERDDVAVYNEKIKLRATTVNAIALTCLAFGFLRPVIDESVILTPDALVWLIGAVATHVIATNILGLIKRKDAP